MLSTQRYTSASGPRPSQSYSVQPPLPLAAKIGPASRSRVFFKRVPPPILCNICTHLEGGGVYGWGGRAVGLKQYRALCCEHCILYTVKCTVHNAYQCKHSTINCKVRTASYAVQRAQCTIHTAKCTLHHILYTIRTAPYALHHTHYTVHTSQRTLNILY